MMTMKWEQISEDVYANEDYSIFVERVGSSWVINEYGITKHRENSAHDAMNWAERWQRGEVIVLH